MRNTNYIGTIVKILEPPKKKIINSKTLVIKLRVQIPQVRRVRAVNLIVWGNLAHAILNYYKVNDYMLVEGYSSVRIQKTSNKDKRKKPLKKVTITAIKVYPFLFNPNRQLKKLS